LTRIFGISLISISIFNVSTLVNTIFTLVSVMFSFSESPNFNANVFFAAIAFYLFVIVLFFTVCVLCGLCIFIFLKKIGSIRDSFTYSNRSLKKIIKMENGKKNDYQKFDNHQEELQNENFSNTTQETSIQIENHEVNEETQEEELFKVSEINENEEE
jgi:ABC-type multidrug transport system fused ATPase/permease subunit